MATSGPPRNPATTGGVLTPGVDRYGFPGRYASVRCNLRHVRGGLAAVPAGIIQAAPGEGAQVDEGKGPMVHETATGKCCRKPLFGMTLGYSHKSVRLLDWR